MTSGIVFAFGAAVAWGLVYVISDKVLENVSPTTLLFVTGILTTALLVPFLLTGHVEFRSVMTSTRPVLALIAVAVILTVIANFFILSSIDRLGATPAALIEIAYPLFTALFAVLLFRTVPSWGLIVGGLLVIAGAAVIIRFP